MLDERHIDDCDMHPYCILYRKKKRGHLYLYVGFCVHYHPDRGCLIHDEYRPQLCEEFKCWDDDREYAIQDAPETAEEAILLARANDISIPRIQAECRLVYEDDDKLLSKALAECDDIEKSTAISAG